MLYSYLPLSYLAAVYQVYARATQCWCSNNPSFISGSKVTQRALIPEYCYNCSLFSYYCSSLTVPNMYIKLCHRYAHIGKNVVQLTLKKLRGG